MNPAEAWIIAQIEILRRRGDDVKFNELHNAIDQARKNLLEYIKTQLPEELKQ
jgi:hypothetical protein